MEIPEISTEKLKIPAEILEISTEKFKISMEISGFYAKNQGRSIAFQGFTKGKYNKYTQISNTVKAIQKD
jgi:hypothetical protein